MNKISMKRWTLTALLISIVGLASAETKILITPANFNFGWAPDNAVIGCEFSIKNLGGEMIPLTAVEPSCGCTATDFTPDALPMSEIKKINLTFHTRGYTNMVFEKPVKVKAGFPEEEFSVKLSGHVTDPDAKVVPVGGGTVFFSSDTKNKKTTLEIENKTDKPVVLTIVQAPASWITFKMRKDSTIPAKSTTEIEVKLGSVEAGEQFTSSTFEASDGTNAYRFTVAFQTGMPPEPYKRIRAAPKETPASKK